MKQKIIYLGFFILVLFLSCTKNFTDINTPTNGFTPNTPDGGDGGGGGSSALSAPALLQTMTRALYSSYQTEQGLSADIFAGYMGTATNFVGNNQNQVYFLVESYNQVMFNNWATVMNNLTLIKDSIFVKDPTEENKAVLGMAYVLNVMITQWAGDYYGTLPYTTFGNPNGSAYQSLELVYDTMFRRLDSALTHLDATQTSTVGVNNTFDLFYAGNQQQWIKLANSLRLRLATRIINIAPAKAKLQFEKATQTNNLLTDNTDNATIHTSLYINDLWVICYNYTDSRLAADMMCFLVGYDDPRLTVYADTVETRTQYIEASGGKYAGVRLGTKLVSKVPFFYSGYGSYAPRNKINPTYQQSPLPFFVAAETQFLLAEGALRGWQVPAGGTAKGYYEDGIKKSMEQWGITDASLINDYLSSTKTEANFIDPTTPDANINAMSTCVPKWDDAATGETKLEQIITQKWLATFPSCGPNAWSEYRRTGYPVLFPPYYSAVFPTITFNGKQVNAARKVRIPMDEYTNNTTNVTNAVNNYLGGVDAITTRIWWDVDPTPLP